MLRVPRTSERHHIYIWPGANISSAYIWHPLCKQVQIETEKSQTSIEQDPITITTTPPTDNPLSDKYATNQNLICTPELDKLTTTITLNR